MLVVLTLAPDEVTDLFVLGLFDGTLIILWSLSKELLLDEINTYRPCHVVSGLAPTRKMVRVLSYTALPLSR